MIFLQLGFEHIFSLTRGILNSKVVFSNFKVFLDQHFALIGRISYLMFNPVFL